MGMSQADLAKALEVSQNTVSKLERNRTRIDTDKIEKLCEVLGLDVSEALTPDQVKNSESKEGYRTIPEYDVRVSAGHGEFQGIEQVKQNLQMPKMFLPENGQVGFVRVEGDSSMLTELNCAQAENGKSKVGVIQSCRLRLGCKSLFSRRIFKARNTFWMMAEERLCIQALGI